MISVKKYLVNMNRLNIYEYLDSTADSGHSVVRNLRKQLSVRT